MCTDISRNTLSAILAKLYQCDMGICDKTGDIIPHDEAVGKVIDVLHKDINSTKDEKIPLKTIKKMEKKEKIQFPFMPNVVNYYTPQCCQGIKLANGLYVVCGTHVKEGQFCKVCIKVPNQTEEFTRRMTTQMGKFDKKEMGLATVLAKQKSKETKNKEDIETWVYAEVDRRIRILDKIPEDIDEYHRIIDWSRINLSGKRGRPKKQPKPVVTVDMSTMVREDDIIGQLVMDAEPADEDDEEEKKEEEDEEEIEVIKLKYKDGKTYYLQESTGHVYNQEEELVGIYDSVLKRIEFENSE
jgi:hypothetical protein